MLFDRKKVKKFPTSPGVYLMRDTHGKVLYIGKANNLKQRVNQYFAKKGDEREVLAFLMPKVCSIDTIVVTSEKEALLLENNLIKKHQPKYNVLLKDDKSYISLKINVFHKWPKIELVRYKGKPPNDGLYFGPYTHAASAKVTLDLIQKIFPLRQCSDYVLKQRKRPCLLYDMKRCIAPCVDYCTKQDYDAYVNKLIQFLRGDDTEILKDLHSQMQQYSNNQEFEKAQVILSTIRQIEKTIEKQYVHQLQGGDFDAVGFYRKGFDVAISVLFFRSGKLMGSDFDCFKNVAQEDVAVLESFLIQHYETQMDIPKEILLPFALPSTSNLSEIISATPRLHYPKKGEKKHLIQMANSNAEANFIKEIDPKVIREKILLEMQERFHLSRFPRRIECFDTSNFSQDDPVASMVVFSEGVKDKSRYRKYRVNSKDPVNDYSSLYDVLMRRYSRAKEENDLPDLMIVDGGKGQLSVATKVLRELNIINVNLLAIAKEGGRHDKGMTQEKIFLSNVKDPILLRKSSPVLFFLQEVRDEAHRFAITFLRKRREKNIRKSALDEIKGIGPKKKQALLQKFGSIKKIAKATKHDLSQVSLLSQNDIDKIFRFFKQ